VSSEEEVKGIAEIMEKALRLEVPNKVDAELGENWGDSMS
jgi:DNA polymerase I-like protein with 3'-5' exonuclease and polymerase domains